MSGGRNTAIIDYGMGNLRSVLRAWEAVGARARLIRSPLEIEPEDLLVFPGQGAIADAMKLLKSTGFDSAIRDWIAADRPFFGICLGLQALFQFSEEGGGTECLGIFEGAVKRLNLPRGFKVPHMGWDDVAFRRGVRDGLLEGISGGDQFYFVHSYYVETPREDIIWGTTEYGGQNFVSAVSRGRLAACQFHPEKSQGKGLLLYSNFLKNS